MVSSYPPEPLLGYCSIPLPQNFTLLTFNTRLSSLVIDHVPHPYITSVNLWILTLLSVFMEWTTLYINGYLYLWILVGTPAILIKVSRDFPQAPTSKFQDSTLIRPWLLPPKSFPIHHSSVIGKQNNIQNKACFSETKAISSTKPHCVTSRNLQYPQPSVRESQISHVQSELSLEKINRCKPQICVDSNYSDYCV